jgi:uncharacterized repeat protein (TIGR01451 family)
VTGSGDKRDRKTFLTAEALRKRRRQQRQVRRAKRGFAMLGIVALLVLGFASAGALARGTSLLDTITGGTDTSATTDTTATTAATSTDTTTTTIFGKGPRPRTQAPTTTTTSSTAAASPDQCANGSGTPQGQSCAWQNGDLNKTNSFYREGDSVPHREVITNLTNGTHELIIAYDTIASGKHAYDYLTSNNVTVSTPNPGVSGCTSFTKDTHLIPAPTQGGSGAPPDPIADRYFSICGGTITAVTAGTFSADIQQIVIDFTSTQANAVISWGGHIASDVDWGQGQGAGSINGSPYHMFLDSIDGGGGSQDRAMQADAVAPVLTPATNASSGTATVGAKVHDTATLSGNSGAASGTVAFWVCSDPSSFVSCDSGGTSVGSTPVTTSTSGGTAQSPDFTVPGAGFYCFRAEYTPDSSSPYSAGVDSNATQQSSGNGGECFSVTMLDSSTATSIEDSTDVVVTHASIGSMVHDTVTVTPKTTGPTPTGTVTFNLFSGTTSCSGTPSSSQSGVALSGGAASSTAVAVPAGGLAYQAVYSGDSTYNASTGPCEQLTGDLLDSGITTAIHDPNHDVVTVVDVGTTVHDSATVTGQDGEPTPTGTVTFSWYANGVCTGDAQATSDALPLSGGAIDATSFTQTPVPAGMYAFEATYNGDGTYNPSTSTCEPLQVNALQPTITTKPSAGGNVGVVLNDSATLANGYQPTGTITFKLYGPGNPTCSTGEGAQAAVFTQDVSVDGNDTYATTGGYKTAAAGTYRWVAVYGGDANNDSAASGCSEEQVTVTKPPVTPPPPPASTPVIDLAITKTGSPSPTTTGTNITWTMVVTNNGPDTATGVNVADPLPAGTTFVSVATTQGSCTGGALIACQLGTIADGGSVTITLVTTATTAGTDTNTATVVGNEQESNTANNTASASVVVNNPPGVFKPPKPKPPVYCAALMVSPKSLFAGRHAVLTMKVSEHRKAVAGIKVRINGAGLLIVTHATNHKGVVKRGVFPKKAGIVTFRPVAQKSCKNTRIGVIGVFTPPVTG